MSYHARQRSHWITRHLVSVFGLWFIRAGLISLRVGVQFDGPASVPTFGTQVGSIQRKQQRPKHLSWKLESNTSDLHLNKLWIPVLRNSSTPDIWTSAQIFEMQVLWRFTLPHQARALAKIQLRGFVDPSGPRQISAEGICWSVWHLQTSSREDLLIDAALVKIQLKCLLIEAVHAEQQLRGFVDWRGPRQLIVGRICWSMPPSPKYSWEGLFIDAVLANLQSARSR